MKNYIVLSHTEQLPLNISGTLLINTNKFGDLKDIVVEGRVIISSNLKVDAFCNLPISTHSLYCNSNLITSLVNLPKAVHTLSLNYNLLKSFEYAHNGIIKLKCCSNSIKSFKHLPSSVKELECDYNFITNFEYLPPNIDKISVSNNPIHDLYKDYDYDGRNVNLIYLLQALKLDSDIHTKEDIHPILGMFKNDYENIRNTIIGIGVNLQTHSNKEILELLIPLYENNENG